MNKFNNSKSFTFSRLLSLEGLFNTQNAMTLPLAILRKPIIRKKGRELTSTLFDCKHCTSISNLSSPKKQKTGQQGMPFLLYFVVL
jgi:hypothetical protein